MFSELLIFFICNIIAMSMCSAIYTTNGIKKLILINISQSGLIVLYIYSSINNILPPFIQNNLNQFAYSDPIPQALMLTSIVVSFATTSIGIALILQIKKSFGCIHIN